MSLHILLNTSYHHSPRAFYIPHNDEGCCIALFMFWWYGLSILLSLTSLKLTRFYPCTWKSMEDIYCASFAVYIAVFLWGRRLPIFDVNFHRDNPCVFHFLSLCFQIMRIFMIMKMCYRAFWNSLKLWYISLNRVVFFWSGIYYIDICILSVSTVLDILKMAYNCYLPDPEWWFNLKFEEKSRVNEWGLCMTCFFWSRFVLAIECMKQRLLAKPSPRPGNEPAF